VTAPLDDEQLAVAAQDHVAAAVDELGQLAQLLTAGLQDQELEQ